MKGNISDLGIAQLIQFPAMSGKSGRLVLERDDQRAQLEYESGELFHATLGDIEGFGVLVEILPWTEGTFEFEVGVGPSVRTIDMDLGKALMRATLQGDDKAAGGAEQPANRHAQSTAAFSSCFGPSWSGKVFARLTTFLAEHPVFFYACVLRRSGEVRAEYVKPADDLGESAQTFGLLRDIMKNYAYVCQDRMVVDASYCTMALRAYGTDDVLIALAKSSVSQEAVAEAIDGLVAKLDDPMRLE
jgi:hypothetical protein